MVLAGMSNVDDVMSNQKAKFNEELKDDLEDIVDLMNVAKSANDDKTAQIFENVKLFFLSFDKSDI